MSTPSVALIDRDFAWTERDTLAVQFAGTGQGVDLSLVIDIYDSDNPAHPHGHYGWWKFPVAQLGEQAVLRITGAPGAGLAVSAPGVELEDSWVNGEIGGARALAINAVLRNTTTNAIIDLARIPGFADSAAIEAMRSGFDRDWSRPRFAPAPYLPRRGETVRIVSPSIVQRDGVGNLCLDLYRMLRQNGVPARLYAQHADMSLNDLVGSYRNLAEEARAEDQVLYFYSTEDKQLDSILALPCRRRTAYFHGVTNPDLLRVFDTELSVACQKALAAVGALRGFERLAANSAVNAATLAGQTGRKAATIAVLPPQLQPADANVSRAGTPRSHALLSVSQIRPHKKIEDLLRLYSAYRELVPEAELHVVGRAPSKAYRDYLHWVETSELNLPPGDVHWHGSVPEEELSALYGTAAAYVSMSEDEGFCLPLVEAMRHGLPVFAHAIPAVAETLGGAGISFYDKDFAHLAAAINQLVGDPLRQAAVVETQRARAAALDARMNGAGFFELLAG